MSNERRKTIGRQLNTQASMVDPESAAFAFISVQNNSG